MKPGAETRSIGAEEPTPTLSSITPRDVPLGSSGLASSLDYLADISAHHSRSEAELGTVMSDGKHSYFGWNEATPADHVSQRAGSAFDPVPKDMLQTWLEPHTDSASNGSLDLIRECNLLMTSDNSMFTPDQQDRHKIDTTDNIPNERFTRVEQCWLAPPNTGRLINSLWSDIAMSPVDNVFSVGLLLHPSEPNVARGSRCGFNEACRQRLQQAFGQMASSQVRPSINRGISPVMPVSLNQTELPPSEILDMALDLYFRLFHPLLPFVHLPTFSAKTAQPSILYVMTLIGMTLLGTKGTTAFVSNAFSVGDHE